VEVAPESQVPDCDVSQRLTTSVSDGLMPSYIALARVFRLTFGRFMSEPYVMKPLQPDTPSHLSVEQYSCRFSLDSSTGLRYSIRYLREVKVVKFPLPVVLLHIVKFRRPEGSRIFRLLKTPYGVSVETAIAPNGACARDKTAELSISYVRVLYLWIECACI